MAATSGSPSFYGELGVQTHRPKRRESRYHSRRSRDWIKIKNMARPAIKGHRPDSQKPSHDCWVLCSRAACFEGLSTSQDDAAVACLSSRPFVLLIPCSTGSKLMATRSKKANTRTKRVAWSKEHVRDLKTHSKSKTPVEKISRVMKRTAGAIRQKALALGIPIGHRR